MQHQAEQASLLLLDGGAARAAGRSVGYGVKNLWKGSRPQMRYPVLYDGDGTRPSGEPFVLGVQGALGHKQKPQCVHISNVHADLLPTDVYSVCMPA